MTSEKLNAILHDLSGMPPFYLKSESLAEDFKDCRQDCLRKIWPILDSDQVENPKAFFREMLRNAERDHLRKLKRLPERVTFESWSGENQRLKYPKVIDPNIPFQAIMESEDRAVLIEKLARFPETWQNIFELKLQQETDEAIAKKLGIKISWVRKCVYRIRLALKRPETFSKIQP